MNPTPTLSLCVIAFNEEDMLPDCLASVANCVNEIVVADTGSTDNTVTVAESVGAQIVHHQWEDDFSAARNASLGAANGLWILILDADERLAPGAGAVIRHAIQQDDFDFGLLPIHNADHLAATPEQILSGHARRNDPVLLPRLFRRTDDLKWHGVVHETVSEWITKGRRARGLDAAILHFGNIPRIRQQRKKSERNLRLLERRCIIEPNNPICRTRLARELLRIGEEGRAFKEIEWAWMDLGVAWSQKPDSPRPQPTEVATLRGFIALNNGQPQVALDTTETVLQWGDDHPNLHLLRAAAIEQMLYEDPVERTRALKSGWHSTEICLQQNGTASTVESLPGATSWAANTVRGLIEIQLGEHKQALESFGNALKIRSEHQPARLGYSEVLGYLGQTQESLKSLEPLLQANVADAWVIAADLAATEYRFKDVNLFLERAEHNRPDPIRSVHRRERARQLRMLCRAWRLYCKTTQQAFVPQEGDPNSLVEIAESHFSNGDLDSAAASLLQAITVDLLHSMAWQDLAVVAHQLGLTEGAQDLLQFALQLDPENVDIQLNLAEMYRAADEPLMAVKTCRRLQRLHPNDSEAHQFLEEMNIGVPNRPVAFFVTSDPSQPAVRQAFETCRHRGFQCRTYLPDVYQALSRRQHLVGDDNVVEQMRRNDPAFVFIDDEAPQANAWRQLCKSQRRHVIILCKEPSTPTHPSEHCILKTSNEPFQKGFNQVVPTADPANDSRQNNARRFLSVVLLCRPDSPPVEPTLDSLALQEIDPSLFEVIIMWLGFPAPPPNQFSDHYGYQITQISQAHPNEASALNQALQHTRAPWVVFFEVGTLLEPQTLRHHLYGQASHPGHNILVGSREFANKLSATPAAKLVEITDVWFPDKNLNGESQCPWRYLHLDNVSIPRSSLISIGGFDQHTFGPGTTAVFELGLRLQKQLGVNITHDPTIRVQCTTIPDLNAVRHRAYQLGYSDYLCWQKHPYEKSFALENVEHPHQTQAFLELRQELIQRQTNIRYAIEVINKQWPLLNKNGNWGEDHLHPLIHAICAYESLKGLVHASTHLPFMPDEDEADFISELTTIVMCNYNGLPSLKKAIHSLREHTTGPVELIVVDNGSADGSPDWLKSQTDIRPVLLPENLGAAAARNRGLELANGSHILFCDNDVEFTPNWRNSLVSHLAAWPDIGAVGPVTDCGPPMQQIRKPGGSTSLTEWATDRALSHTDQFRYTNRLGGFCLMIRRDVIDDVGGFDEDFFPFGFEVDDFCVRLGLVGWRMRIIDHCAIAHQGRGRESTAVLGYEAVIERNWKHFKTNWNLPADLAVSELNLQHIVKSCPYDAEEHRIPYRSAEGYMEADEPVLLISTRQTLTGV